MFGAYKLYSTGAYAHLPFLKTPGAFDADGKPIVRLFVGPECTAVCGEIETMLQTRKIDFELIDITSPEGRKYGVHQYPQIQVGKEHAVGGKLEIVAALASGLGPEVLSHSERLAMQNNFDENGRAIVMMYATEWCPYCKKQREYFRSHDIAFSELDPEK